MGNAPTNLRVALLTTYYHPVIGGVESHARQIACELQRRGIEVRVLTKRLDAATPVEEEIDGVSVTRVRPSGRRTWFAKWLLVPFAASGLVRMRPKPQVIFCPDFRGIGIAALAAGRILGIPVILQAETPGALSCDSWDPELARWGIRPSGVLGRALKAPFRRIYASAALYPCISRQNEHEALRCGVAPDRLHYVPHGVDVVRFRPPAPEERAAARAAAGVHDDRLIVLFVGRLSLEKGVLDLLEAWRQLSPSHAVLVLVGPDMPGHALDAGAAARALVDRHALADSVRFVGPTGDPSGIMRAADLFVQPSHYEAFGVSAIEAMATGLPLVATGVGGMTDYMRDGDNALVSEPRRPDMLARQIGRLLQDGELRARIAVRARATAVEQFDKDIVADSYARLMRQVFSANADA